MPSKKVMIIGASGHGKVIADIIHQSGDQVMGFLDDDPTKKEIHQIPVLGKIEDTQKYKDDFCFIIGIGDNQIRKKIAERNPALNSIQPFIPLQLSERVSVLVRVQP